MSDQLHYLDDAQPLEVRDFEAREVAGRVIPYGEIIQIRGRPESFSLGALANIDPSKTKLLRDHDPKSPLGKVVELEERADGAYAVFKVSKTSAGNEALELARDGVLSFSPGFILGTQQRDGAITSVKALPEVSLVTYGAYQGAQVTSVRSETEEVSNMSENIEAPQAEAVDLSAIESRFDHVEASLAKIEASQAPAATNRKAPEPLDWFIGEVQAVALGKTEKRAAYKQALVETRALDEVIGVLDSDAPSDADGLVQEAYLSGQLVHVLDARRPFFASLGSFLMPKSGYAKIPVVTQNTLVDVRAGQLEDANSRALEVETVPFEAIWLDGAVRVSLEIIEMSEPGVLGMIWSDLLTQLARRQEELAISIAFDAGAHTGAALDTTDYGSFAADVATQALQVRNLTGMGATKLALPYSVWPSIVAMVDATDRRQFTSGDHSDASVGLTSESFSLPGGITVFAADVPAAALYNGAAIRAADGGPSRVEATVVEIMARDIGLLGRVMVVPRIPDGIRIFDDESSS